MLRAGVFALLGMLTLTTSTLADLRGWLGKRPSLVQNVPRSIRDNPGAYRSIYTGSPRYFGGK